VNTVRPIRADTGLCQYEDFDNWFSKSPRIQREAKAICTNCPIIASCAQRALDLDATNGIWASVFLPGVGDAAGLEAARDRLLDVIKRYQHQPAELRRRSLRIRQAVHFAATQRQRRARTPGPGHTIGPTTATDKASA
jgi:WhiB family transcriptional regulator, redox-sensing transcriptional regulator